MRLLILFLLAGLLHVSAATNAQTVTLKGNHLSFEKVLQAIRLQTGYTIFTAEHVLNNARPISVDARNMPVDQFLTTVFADQPLEAIIEDKTIIIKKKNNPHIPITENPEVAPIQQRMVAGQVTDEQGNPLEGVTVRVNGTNVATTTDANGRYELRIPDEGSTLTYSNIGFISVERPIGSQSVLDVSLEASISDLDEVVVVGYGTQRKSDLTGAVSQIKGEVVSERNAVQLSQALQGTIPGLRISRTGSNPNTPATIRVRGITTIGTSDPLVIIDGIPGDINRVNAADVESISVLKDAASASIYGSRAAAGVILVTTKRASKGSVGFHYNYEYGLENVARVPQEVDGQSYMRIYNERTWNDNGNADGFEHSMFLKDLVDNYPELNRENPDQYPQTNWFEMMLRSNAPRQTHNLNFTAGGENVQTTASLDYTEVKGINRGHDYERITFRVNNDFKVNSKLTGMIDVNGIRTANNRPRTMATPNTIPPGVIYPAVWSDGRIAEGLSGANPYAQIVAGGFNNSADNTFSGRIGLDFELVKGLKLSGRFAPTVTFVKTKDFSRQIPYTSYDNPDYVVGYIQGYANTNLVEQRSDAFSHITQLMASYNKEVGSHVIDVLGGYENYYTTDERLSATRNNFQLSNFPYLDLGNANYQFNAGGASELAYRSWFGRISYSYASKYLLQINGRHDASSRFSKAHRGAFFPSVSAGWVISEESFFDGVSWLSHLKARASWGILGNERIGDNYPYQSTIGFSNSTVYQGGTPVSVQAARVNRYAIPAISWETTASYDFGIDANFFNNRLNIVADYYRKTTHDMLLELEVPRFIGLQNPNQNAGEMYTTGWEFETGWRDRIGNLGYRLSFNITDSKSIMGDLGGTQFIGNQVILEGHEYNAWYGYLTDGIFQTTEAVDNMPTVNANVRQGDIRILDVSGPDGVPDGRISPEYDRVVLGGSLARYLYGGNIRLDYKNFDFSLFFQGVGKQTVQMPLAWVQPVTRIPKLTEGEYWSHYNSAEENQGKAFPRVSGQYQANNYSTLSNFWLFNGAYFRLKNIALGYTLPEHLTERIGTKRLRLYATASDLFSLSDYPSDRDPEGSNDFITTSYVFGVSINF